MIPDPARSDLQQVLSNEHRIEGVPGLLLAIASELILISIFARVFLLDTTTVSEAITGPFISYILYVLAIGVLSFPFLIYLPLSGLAMSLQTVHEKLRKKPELRQHFLSAVFVPIFLSLLLLFGLWELFALTAMHLGILSFVFIQLLGTIWFFSLRSVMAQMTISFTKMVAAILMIVGGMFFLLDSDLAFRDEPSSWVVWWLFAILLLLLFAEVWLWYLRHSLTPVQLFKRAGSVLLGLLGIVSGLFFVLAASGYYS